MRTDSVSNPSPIAQAGQLLEQVFGRLGDMLADLAARHGVSEPALRAANPGIGERLAPGEAVRLPPPQAEAVELPAVHTVHRGETLSGIARENHMGLRELLALNPQIRDPNRISVGQRIALEPGTATTNAAPAAATTRPADSGHTLGDLSRRYETGGRGPGTVSGGHGDAGGVSYGSYQLATRRGRPAEFLAHEGAPWADRFAGQAPGTAAFSATWRQIAREQPAAFHAAQHDYIQRTHYTPLEQGVQRRTGLDADTRSAALRDVIWSTAVQHGPGSRIIDTAIGQVDARMQRSDPGYDRALIGAIYAERGRRDADGQLHHFRSNSAAVQAGVAQRFIDERADALRMLTP